MVPCHLTCVDVAYVCKRCRHLPTSRKLWHTRQGRSVAGRAPVPATLPGDLDRGASAKGARARAPERSGDGAVLHVEIPGAPRGGTGLS
jgi:hypothetical protein